MYYLLWMPGILGSPEPEPTIIDQAPNYGGPSTTVFYLAGGIILFGAVVLWGIYLVRNRDR
ncbi:hypothetical protein [Enteractinococcus helveticum]|uniref:Uncharacterized protein n=1 Tax=Enteractinococcus helveticum TaxID=1837282 RepID=A0A1B7LVK8_9MICC|nr:hypothetical protein [Enteractinococcus helveticum]OAV53919.1 hypothetical protein A6F49_00580 [Enteractinococcus helveticum]